MKVLHICADRIRALQPVPRAMQAAFELAPDGQLADAAAALAEVDMDEREASGQAVALHLSATGGFPPALSGDGRDGSAVGSKRRRTDKEGRPSEFPRPASAATSFLTRPRIAIWDATIWSTDVSHLGTLLQGPLP